MSISSHNSKTQSNRVLVVFEMGRARIKALELNLVAEFPDIFRIILCKLFVFAVSIVYMVSVILEER